MGGLKRGPKSGTPEMQALMKAKRKEKNRIAMRARRAEKKRMSSAVTRAGYGNIPWGIVNQKRASLGGGAAKARGNVAEGLALCAMANSKKKQTQRREINDLVIPGSLPLTGIDYDESHYHLLSLYGQAGRTGILLFCTSLCTNPPLLFRQLVSSAYRPRSSYSSPPSVVSSWETHYGTPPSFVSPPASCCPLRSSQLSLYLCPRRPASFSRSQLGVPSPSP